MVCIYLLFLKEFTLCVTDDESNIWSTYFKIIMNNWKQKFPWYWICLCEHTISSLVAIQKKHSCGGIFWITIQMGVGLKRNKLFPSVYFISCPRSSYTADWLFKYFLSTWHFLRYFRGTQPKEHHPKNVTSSSLFCHVSSFSLITDVVY